MRSPLIFAVLLVLPSACEPPAPEPCTEIAVPGVVVRVDNNRGEPACDAEVTLSSEGFDEALVDGFIDEGACVFSGAIERAGTYEVEIGGRGYIPQTETVPVSADECHVITEELAITLEVDCPEEPNPGLEVIVRDDANQPLCNVTVRAVDGAFSEDLQSLQLGPGNCRFVGLFERAGTYSLEVDANPPFADLVTPAEHVVATDICGIVQTDVGLTLSREGAECPPFIAPMFDLTVVDDSNTTAICDAQVVASEGGFSTTLLPNGCQYQDLGDNRAGTYTLDISRAGFESLQVTDVVVGPDATGCTVATHTETYALTPLP